MSISIDGPPKTASLFTVALVYVHDGLQICANNFSCEVCNVNFADLYSNLDWGPNKDRCDSAEK